MFLPCSHEYQVQSVNFSISSLTVDFLGVWNKWFSRFCWLLEEASSLNGVVWKHIEPDQVRELTGAQKVRQLFFRTGCHVVTVLGRRKEIFSNIEKDN